MLCALDLGREALSREVKVPVSSSPRSRALQYVLHHPLAWIRCFVAL